MDFADSPEEAAFRDRLRAWVADNNPDLPASSTDDAYWAGQAAWHQSLYDAGFFGLSWPVEVGGHGLPERLRRDPRRGARRRRRAAAARSRLPRAGHPPPRQRRHPGPLPARSGERPRSLVPGLQRARCRLRPGRAAHPCRPRRRRLRDPRPQGLDQLLRRRRPVHRAGPHRSRRAQAQGHLGVRRADGPAGRAAHGAQDDQRHHQGVRRGRVRRGPRARGEHDRRAR